jgi:hypothetical protein
LKVRLPFLRSVLGLALATALGLSSIHAGAQSAPSEASRREARERFDRGLVLFNQGDNAGALAEFTRAYELVPHPLVLFNMGLVHTTARHPVEAVAAFDKLLADPGQLGAKEVELARRSRDEQATRIGEIAITTDVPGAQIEVDNIPRGTTPLREPVRVASGEHLVSAIAKNRYPERRQVVVAGKSRIDVALVLRELNVNLARLTVKTNVIDADVLVDGTSVGKTPLSASLAFAPGPHVIEARRAGYVTAQKSVTLGEGTTGAVQLDLAVDQAWLRSEGASLRLAISEPDAVVFIDDVPRGAYARPITLPPGKHVLRVERAEFFAFERQIEVPAKAELNVPINLQPTPEKRASYRGAAITQRTLGITGVIAGAAIAAGGGGFLIINQGKKNDAQEKFDNADLNTPGGDCEPGTAGQASKSTDACVAELNIRLRELKEARDRDKYGWIGVGVGGAVLVTGLVLLFTNNDPNRYEPKPESDVFAKLRVTPTAWLLPGSAGAGLVGAF